MNSIDRRIARLVARATSHNNMAHPPRFPRRHAQRQALNHGRAKTPPSDKRRRSFERAAKKEQRSSTSSDCDDSDSDSEFDNNSGYNSTADLDAKAEYYRQKKAEFVAAGPALSNPCDSTKEMMRAAEQKWAL